MSFVDYSYVVPLPILIMISEHIVSLITVLQCPFYYTRNVAALIVNNLHPNNIQ